MHRICHLTKNIYEGFYNLPFANQDKLGPLLSPQYDVFVTDCRRQIRSIVAACQFTHKVCWSLGRKVEFVILQTSAKGCIILWTNVTVIQYCRMMKHFSSFSRILKKKIEKLHTSYKAICQLLTFELATYKVNWPE